MAIIKNPLTIVQTGGGENKLPQVIDRTITTLTANDLQGATSIGDYAFYQCFSLKTVTIPDNIKNIGRRAFYNCSNLISINIPESMTNIADYAFYGCSSLTSITIPNSVVSIDSSAFSGCASLAEVYISNIVSWCGISFGNYVANPLYYGGKLYLNGQLVTNLEIPNNVTSINEGAFSGCSSLTSVTIPSSVTSIGSWAFNGCDSLTTMTILATTPPTLTSTKAISTATTKIYIPAGTLSAYQSATNWSNFADKFEELPA